MVRKKKENVTQTNDEKTIFVNDYLWCSRKLSILKTKNKLENIKVFEKRVFDHRTELNTEQVSFFFFSELSIQQNLDKKKSFFFSM